MKDIPESEVQKYLEAELSFLEACLRVNPKAYGIWLHREWVMLNIPNPNWKREQELCNLFLKYDERNFHCWDYRRFAIQHSGVSNEEELAFTSAKIADNFSNYSAWHYRSKLLPLVDAKESGQLSKEVSDREFELVQNAFFTDPGDQSAWFYHNWLLGKANPPLIVMCLLALRRENKMAVVFNKRVKINECEDIGLFVNKERVEGVSCHTLNTPPSWPASLWICVPESNHFPSSGSIDVEFQWNSLTASCTIGEDYGEGLWVNLPAVDESFESKSACKDVLKRELEMCSELLQLEPDNKWCILTTLTLSQAVDPASHCDKILDYFDRLIKKDPYRSGYYMDRRSKFIAQLSVLECLKKTDKPLDLSNKGLTQLYCPELMCFVREVNLAGNPMRESLDCTCLLSVVRLNLTNTGLKAINSSFAGLSRLTALYLDDNNICSVEDLEGLRGCGVRVLSMKGNPLLDKMADSELTASLKTLCPALTEFNGRKL